MHAANSFLFNLTPMAVAVLAFGTYVRVSLLAVLCSVPEARLTCPATSSVVIPTLGEPLMVGAIDVHW